MKYKTLLAAFALAAMVAGQTSVAFAQEAVMTTPTETIIATQSPEDILRAELADLKIKEADPTIGFVAKFFIRLKIRETENKLGLQQAFQ